MDHCSVVIVNFNAGDFLRQAVESVLRSACVSQVYVIDNASTDDSIESLAQVRDCRLMTISNSRNLGFAAACNVGIAHATAENVLLLNPDCRVEAGSVEHMIAALYSADRVGMVGPLLLNPDGSEQRTGRRKFPTPRVAFKHTIGSTWLRNLFSVKQDPLPTEPVEIEAISGACMMVRRDAITLVGPLDERYFLHCEDLDWCMRFYLKGLKILFVPAAEVFHQKGVSSRTRPLAMEYYKHRGIIRLYRKFLRETHSRGMLALVFAVVWLRFATILAWRVLSRGWR